MQHNSTHEAEIWFHQMATHYVEAQILFHLNRCGVFVYLASCDNASSETIAGELGLEYGVVDVLLQYLSRVSKILTFNPERGFSFTDFGRVVLERYSRCEGDDREINFFNTRVGAFGVVWSALDKMLRGEFKYGVDFHRDGTEAQTALYRSSIHFLPRINEVIARVAPESAIELGVGSGLSDRIKEAHPSMQMLGVDKNERAFRDTRARSAHLDIDFAHAFVEEVESWAGKVEAPDRALVLSIHFHEFLVGMSDETITATLQQLRKSLRGSHLLVLEQPDLQLPSKEATPTVEWLHAQSNYLIHNVIQNGRILTTPQWLDLFISNGLRLVEVKPTGFIGYQSFLFALD